MTHKHGHFAYLQQPRVDMPRPLVHVCDIFRSRGVTVALVHIVGTSWIGEADPELLIPAPDIPPRPPPLRMPALILTDP